MNDRVEGNQLIMFMPDKEALFNDSRNGLYYNYLEDRDVVLVNTMEENREGFSCIELSRDREAMRALAMFGYPSQKTFEKMARTINNYPVTIEDIWNANTIY